MKIKCNKCDKEWEYKGKSKIYVTCPQCHSSINILKQNYDEGKGGAK